MQKKIKIDFWKFSNSCLPLKVDYFFRKMFAVDINLYFQINKIYKKILITMQVCCLSKKSLRIFLCSILHHFKVFEFKLLKRSEAYLKIKNNRF